MPNIAARWVFGVCGLLMCVAGVLLFSFSQSGRAHRVKYVTHRGDDPVEIDMEFVTPSDSIESVPLTLIPTEFGPGQLLSLTGSLAVGPKETVKHVVVEFIEHRQNGIDVLANSAVKLPEGNLHEFSFLVNCPLDPGEYDLRMTWGAPESYIARAKVIVVKTP